MAKQKKKKNKAFNGQLFAADILKKRISDNIVYAQSIEKIGVNASVLHRAESGLDISLPALVKIANWLDEPVQKYFQ